MSEHGWLGNDATGGPTRHRCDGTSRDELFEALAHGRRRRTLAYLRGVDGSVSVSDLASHVAAERCEDGRVTPSERKQVATSLYHVHLPKLIESGLVDWGESGERRAVTITSAGQSLPSELSWMPTVPDTDGE